MEKYQFAFHSENTELLILKTIDIFSTSKNVFVFHIFFLVNSYS